MRRELSGLISLIVLLFIMQDESCASDTNSVPPTPAEMGISPPSPVAVSYDAETGVTTWSDTTETTNLVLKASATNEWELTFEWVPELGSTNVSVYPIRLQVPFEHDGGFIYVRARKVKVE